HQAIRAAEAAGRSPPWNTPLGGGIRITAEEGPAHPTLGSVVLSSAAMEEIWKAVPLQTPVQLLEE
ncbi:MAG: hypothetical protein V1918_02825, partial [Planctomycetota bacterium]